MGTSLNGLTPAGTYPGLIKTGDNAPIDGTLKTLSDGNGNNLPMEASTTAVNFTNQLQQGGVAVPTASQVNAKQDTLVSGTNIKTINGTSVLGSGNIVTPSTPPSGVAGAIQFSNGSAFASDATNLFWDDTNKRLGVRTNAPAYPLDVTGTIRANVTNGINIIGGTTDTRIYLNATQGSEISYQTWGFSSVGGFNQIGGNTTISANLFRNGSLDLGARLGIRGSGSTSATTSLLVQNSSAQELFKIADDGGLSAKIVGNFSTMSLGSNGDCYMGIGNTAQFQVLNTASTIVARSPAFWFRNDGGPTGQYYANFTGGQFAIGKSTTQAVASALIEMSSTTMGFLPPRMTTTQKNAIASPAAGLQVYDTTTNKLCCYNGSTWNDLF